jgi:multidrug efflux pump subunit AcrA (membrane-fusion protein)
VLVEVKDPLDPPQGELPLLPGAFVRVEIDGRNAQDVAPVPREAVFGGDRVWIVADDDTLQPSELQIAWSDDETVFARSGVEDGARLLLTDLPALVEGMSVRVSESTDTRVGALEETSPDAG